MQPAEAAHPLCSNGQSTDGVYPKANYSFDLLNTPPDLAFDAPSGPIALHDYFEPCAPTSRLLISASVRPWCGTCFGTSSTTPQT